jgi:hypothetical protein
MEINFTPNDLASERWKPVVDLEEFYTVSSLGRVKRIKAGPGARVGRILKPSPNGGKYLHVQLCAFGKSISCEVHRLVASAFIGPLPAGRETNHKDGIKTNNRFRNLEYLTQSGNAQHAIKLGLIRHGPRASKENFKRGSDHPHALLTDAKVNAMRAVYDNSDKHPGILRELADQFDTEKTNVFYIVNRKTWRHLA